MKGHLTGSLLCSGLLLIATGALAATDCGPNGCSRSSRPRVVVAPSPVVVVPRARTDTKPRKQGLQIKNIPTGPGDDIKLGRGGGERPPSRR
jgi:hypothetical protein